MRTEKCLDPIPLSPSATLIGVSTHIAKARQFAERVAKTELSVLICGQSGSGKEILAQMVHDMGRGNKPFLAINCANLNDHLLESELFGHEKGSFTGAHQLKKGKLELAGEGTLF